MEMLSTDSNDVSFEDDSIDGDKTFSSPTLNSDSSENMEQSRQAHFQFDSQVMHSKIPRPFFQPSRTKFNL